MIVPEFNRQFGETLVETGNLAARDLQRALKLCEANSDRINRILPKLGLLSEEVLAHQLAGFLNIPILNAASFPQTPITIDNVSFRFMKNYHLVPVAVDEKEITVAMTDPVDDYAIKAMRMSSGRNIAVCVAMPVDIERALTHYDQVTVNVEGDEFGRLSVSEEDIERLRDLASEAPVVQTVSRIINQAVELNASDIHIEPQEDGLRLRLRQDGLLKDQPPPPADMKTAIVSRIKIMAQLDIAERRLPQDGRINLVVRGNAIDIRVSTVPTTLGESVVLRILDRSAVQLDFETLGFQKESRRTYLEALAQPNGIILVTGPTGSGKTTTLYTSLLHINAPEKNIASVEDPVEFHLSGINQTQVKPDIGLDFANVLRALLRHDPDVIMLGEIRDKETADVSIQAALTGHLVLSTLHTNSAAGTLARLNDMGIESYLITSTLIGVLSQRLVRRLCPQCRQPYTPSTELLNSLNLEREQFDDELCFYHAHKCEACHGNGYAGRIAISETLILNDPLRDLIHKNAAANDLQTAAVANGMETIFENGLARVIAGDTSLEELLKAVRPT